MGGGTPPSAETTAGAGLPDGTSGTPELLMMGRSVVADWFVHWGWDGVGPAERDGHAVYYGQLQEPPAVGTSAAALIGQVPAGTVLYFQLSFEDFGADDENLDENLGYVRQVADAADAGGMALILGNALPRVRAETTPELVKSHVRYNEALEGIAAANHSVIVFDQYDVLASPQDGSLRKGFAVDLDDSHLTEAAYKELDVALRETWSEALVE